MAELEDKYSRFRRNTDIDLLAEIAAGGESGGLDNYYTKAQSDTITDALDDRVTDLEAAPGGGVTDHGALTGLTDDDHTQYHNDTRGDIRYYTKAQVDTSLSGKSDTSHNHDSRYYTETEVDNLLDDKVDLSELTDYAGVSDTPRYLMFNTTWPARPADTRMTFYIGGTESDTPADAVTGDVWIPGGL
jgi:hypothetical protein